MADGHRTAEQTTLKKSVNSDVGDAENVGSFLHGVSQAGKIWLF